MSNCCITFVPMYLGPIYITFTSMLFNLVEAQPSFFLNKRKEFFIPCIVNVVFFCMNSFVDK